MPTIRELLDPHDPKGKKNIALAGGAVVLFAVAGWLLLRGGPAAAPSKETREATDKLVGQMKSGDTSGQGTTEQVEAGSGRRPVKGPAR